MTAEKSGLPPSASNALAGRIVDRLLEFSWPEACPRNEVEDCLPKDVWLGDSPMGINEGAKGDQVLLVEFPDDVELGDFEVVEEEKPYREWCVPAALINSRATVTLTRDENDADVVRCARCSRPLPSFNDPEFKTCFNADVGGEVIFVCKGCVGPGEVRLRRRSDC